MMSNTLTYTNLDCLLAQLGFHPISAAGTHRVFENPAYEATILLPRCSADEIVRPHHIVAIRRTVIDKGIADQETFDRLLRSSLLARA